MRLVLLGSPGAGKGTQAQRLIAKHGIVHLSTGDILRAAAGTPIGQRAKAIMDRGELVPDDMVVAIIAERIDRPDARRGFVLDGFPRTVAQAEALERLLAERGLKLDAVIEIKVDEGILLNRIERRVAEMTARGQQLRADDNPEVLKGRLAAYRAQTAPLAGHYAAKGMLKSVDGMAPIEAVAAAIDRMAPVGRATPAAKPKRAKKPAKAAKSRHRKARGKAKPRSTRRRRAAAPRKPQSRRKNKSGRRKSGSRRG
jgi:adenylate kinase